MACVVRYSNTPALTSTREHERILATRRVRMRMRRAMVVIASVQHQPVGLMSLAQPRRRLSAEAPAPCELGELVSCCARRCFYSTGFRTQTGVYARVGTRPGQRPPARFIDPARRKPRSAQPETFGWITGDISVRDSVSLNCWPALRRPNKHANRPAQVASRWLDGVPRYPLSDGECDVAVDHRWSACIQRLRYS